MMIAASVSIKRQFARSTTELVCKPSPSRATARSFSNYPKTISSPGFYGGYTPFSDSYLSLSLLQKAIEGSKCLLCHIRFSGCSEAAVPN